MAYPQTRLRRLRANESIREMVRETGLSPADFIYPMFVAPGLDVKVEVPSMPGIYRFSADLLAAEAARAREADPGRSAVRPAAVEGRRG